MIFSLIVCVNGNFGIGKDNDIPWKFSKDLSHFKKITTSNKEKNSIIIMGNNTYKSLPDNFKPLPNRMNLVLSKQIKESDNENLKYFNSIISLLCFININKEKYNDEVFVIGGSYIYNMFLELKIITNLYITLIHSNKEKCDTYFNFNKYIKHFKLENECNEYDINKVDNLSYVLNFRKYTYINKDEKRYIDMINKILKKGIYKLDRTKVGTLSLFGKSLKYDIRNYRLPLFTHRKMFYKGILEELLFFISGNTNTKLLEEKKVNIWKGNTSREFLDSRNLQHLHEGDLGAGYSFQLRHFGADYINCNTDYSNQGFDQLEYVVNLLKTDPASRRILFSYWNPSAMKKMALPPCHLLYQFHVNTDTNELSCSFYQRSSDFVLAANFNIVSAALLTFMLCHITGYKPGKIIHNIGDIHIYMNHIEGAKQLLNNEPLNFPILHIDDSNKKITNITDFTVNNFKLLFYNSYPKYAFKMAI
jgi:dihydrofolate reductase/thymidylate synthase